MFIENKKLAGEFVALEPLNEAHIEGLVDAVRDGNSWDLWFANVPHPESMRDYVLNAMEGAKQGNIAYAVRLKATNSIVGTTRFYNVYASNKRAMIGYTWYADKVKRTAVNTECKLLLLTHLFEQSKAIAAEFRTHVANQSSRAAIERLGAKQDGILRNHQILKDGSYRDTVVYSIIESEWPRVKANLSCKLKQ